MIETSDAYKAAITGTVRRVRPRIMLEVTDPDMEYGNVSGSAQHPASKSAEVLDNVEDLSDAYASFETNRWVLHGGCRLLTATSGGTYTKWDGETGYVTSARASAAAVFSTGQRVRVELSGVDVLQAVRVTWPGDSVNGYATDFTVAIESAGTVYHTAVITGNTDHVVKIKGFTVYLADAVVITVTGWSVPGRCARFVEIFAGYDAVWGADEIQSVTANLAAQVSCMNLPHGTATVVFDNSDGLFDPRAKTSLYASLEERQPIPIELGVDLEDGTTEYIALGTFYQHERAWATTDANLTLRWDLVDIVGLLSDRTYVAPDALPVTLEGWVRSLTDQLGGRLAGCYHVDPDYADISLETETDQVNGKNCGDILRWVCQATGTFPRADAETGYLTVEPMWDQGAELTLDNVTERPRLAANDTIGSIIFQFPDDDAEDLVVTGNDAVSANNLTVGNPFITTNAQALVAARNILVTYGGNRIVANGRGDMSCEVGDVSTVELMDGSGASARLTAMTLNYQNGILQGCRYEFQQPSGRLIYSSVEVLTTDQTWTAPDGVDEIYVILVGGGSGGGHGTRGSYYDSLFHGDGWITGSPGDNGEDGAGGKVLYRTMQINNQQRFAVTIGKGGRAASSGTAPVEGTATTFGPLTSADGRVYTPSFTDISSGNSYGRTGAATPTANRGDGGKGGAGGHAGAEYWESDPNSSAHSQTRTDIYPPGEGSAGRAGSNGCVVIWYEK